METAPVPTAHNVMQDFDESMERLLGADMRLIYGLAIPVLMIVGLVVLLAVNPSTWLVIGIVVLEILALGLVVTGLMTMMSDSEPEADHGG